jgi:hypothetical protein
MSTKFMAIFKLILKSQTAEWESILGGRVKENTLLYNFSITIVIVCKYSILSLLPVPHLLVHSSFFVTFFCIPHSPLPLHNFLKNLDLHSGNRTNYIYYVAILSS